LLIYTNSTNGANWGLNTHWLTRRPVKSWYGITVTGTRVTAINLEGDGLSGSIPSSIGNLSNLTYLTLAYNSINKWQYSIFYWKSCKS
jgi:hypothetical protein